MFEEELWPINETFEPISTSHAKSESKYNVDQLLEEFKACVLNLKDEFPTENEVSNTFAALSNQQFVEYVDSQRGKKSLFVYLAALIKDGDVFTIPTLISRILCILHSVPERKNKEIYEALIDSKLISSVAGGILKVPVFENFDDFPGLLMDLIIFCPKSLFTFAERFDLLGQKVIFALMKFLKILHDPEIILHTLMALNLLMEISYINGTFSYFSGDFMLSGGFNVINMLKRIKTHNVLEVANQFGPRFSELFKTGPGQRHDKSAGESSRRRYMSAPAGGPSRRTIETPKATFDSWNFLDI